MLRDDDLRRFENFAQSGLYARNVAVANEHAVAAIQVFGVVIGVRPVARMGFGTQ
jgi:hypothetical protein